MSTSQDNPLQVSATDADRLLSTDHHEPHGVLGLHPLKRADLS